MMNFILINNNIINHIILINHIVLINYIIQQVKKEYKKIKKIIYKKIC